MLRGCQGFRFEVLTLSCASQLYEKYASSPRGICVRSYIKDSDYPPAKLTDWRLAPPKMRRSQFTIQASPNSFIRICTVSTNGCNAFCVTCQTVLTFTVA